MEQVPQEIDHKRKRELDAMEASQILDMNRQPDCDCSYSTRPIHKKRSRVGLGICLGIVILLTVGAIVVFSLFDISLERINGGYSLRVQRWDCRTEEDTAAPGQVDLPDEGFASGQFSLSLYPMASSGAVSDAMSLQDIYDTVRPSVVSLLCDGPVKNTGTGVILDEDGLIVTCAHVVCDVSEIQVLLADDRQYSASLLGIDQDSDLAVLKIEAEDLKAAEFVNSDYLAVGDPVVAIGDPLGIQLRGTMTEGIISGLDRTLTVGEGAMKLIQTNTALNAGNSGGPLINCYGQVVGINSAKIGSDSGFSDAEGLGFAIPSSTVQQVVSRLLADSYSPDGQRLGLVLTDPEGWQTAFLELPDGVYVENVIRGTDASAVGIEGGDLLIAINGTPVTLVSDVEQILSTLETGEQVEVQILRRDKVLVCTVRLQ